jgi:hypothetical protein
MNDLNQFQIDNQGMSDVQVVSRMGVSVWSFTDANADSAEARLDQRSEPMRTPDSWESVLFPHNLKLKHKSPKGYSQRSSV